MSWDALERDLATYPSVVVTWLDEAGYPFSVRCPARVDRTAPAIVVELPASAAVVPGPAGLLCHAHDEQLWHLRSFILKGALEGSAGDWLFVPERRTDGAGYDGLRGFVRFVRNGRRTAKAYLRRRDLPPPRIDWQRMKVLKQRAFPRGAHR